MRELIAALSMIATLGITGHAHATDCGSPFGFDALPAFMTEAPRNTRVWLLGYPSTTSSGRYQWHDAKGAPVSFSLRRVPVSHLFLDILVPDQPLNSRTSYEVETCWGDDSSLCSPVTTFQTSDELDEQAPDLPQIEEREPLVANRRRSDSTRLARFSVRGDAIVVADADGEGLDSPLDDEARLAALSQNGEVHLGEGPCHPRSFEGAHADVRFGTFDLAGNFSGFTEPESVKLPELDGCALAARRDGGWMALLVLAVLSRRRRSAQPGTQARQTPTRSWAPR